GAGDLGEEGSTESPAQLHALARPVERGLGEGAVRSLQPGDHRRTRGRRQEARAADRDDVRRRVRRDALEPARATRLVDAAGAHQEPAPPRIIYAGHEHY